MGHIDNTILILDLDGMLNAASHGLREVHQAYHEGNLDEDHIDWMLCMRDSLAQWLAHFEDGHGYGDVSPRTTNVMRDYESMATSMLEAVGYK
jgi:hypothetical protein